MRIPSLCLLLVLFGCASGENSPAHEAAAEPDAIPFRIDGALEIVRDGATLLTIDIEIADNDSTRERGMMQRNAFPDRTGMLFVFDQAQPQQFWMGNTPLALDLLFADADLKIVDFAKYAVPFSNEPLTSRVPAQYVLEVPAGWVDSNGIVEGDEIRWHRN